MRKSIVVVAAALLGVSLLFAGNTQVTDTVYKRDGTPYSGTLKLQQEYLDGAGHRIGVWDLEIAVNAGVLNASIGTGTWRVSYQGSDAPRTEYWIIPGAGYCEASACTLKEVRSSLFGAVIQGSQIENPVFTTLRVLQGIPWYMLTSKPSSTAANIDDAVSKRHSHAPGVEPTCMSATDLVVDHTDNKKVSSASHNFEAGDVGERFQITGGEGWMAGDYYVVSVAGNAATLNTSPAPVDAAAGEWNINRSLVVKVEGSTGASDSMRVCRKNAADAFAWTALY